MIETARWREDDARLLDFERTWWTHQGSKEASIRERLDLSGAAYYRRLAEIVELPEALAHDVLLVRRLRRQRVLRRRLRSEQRVQQRSATGG